MTADGRTAMPSEADDFAFAGHERRRQDGREFREGNKAGRYERRSRPTARIHINIGSSAGLLPKHIVGTVAGETGLPGKFIGRIEINERYATFDVPQETAAAVIDTLNKTRMIGRKITARLFNE